MRNHALANPLERGEAAELRQASTETSTQFEYAPPQDTSRTPQGKSIDDFLVMSLNLGAEGTQSPSQQPVEMDSNLSWRVPMLVCALGWILALSLLAVSNGVFGMISALLVLFAVPAVWLAWQLNASIAESAHNA